ncbi:uncharacterized protein LOC111271707 [Varroa jacobsoni]|uniref:uncharacterized protein LOC111271707 n=1 Tax=Varroa jacobsoni TaxID=62625 RepID=UPI000BF2DFA7|nr:uncharacterized protein LOC111271707 [Varroa jacobsoni]
MTPQEPCCPRSVEQGGGGGTLELTGGAVPITGVGRMAEAADSQTTLSNGSSAISLSSPSPIKHKPQYNADQAVVTYESEGACVNCCIVFFYVVGMVLIAVGIGATAMITQYPEHVLYLAMTGASGIILGLIFVSLSATICSPRRRRVVDAKSDVNGNAGNQQNGKAGPRLPLGSTLGAHGGTHGLPSTNRYEVRAGGSADVIDDNLVLSSSPKMHQQPSSETTNTAAAYQSTNDSRSAQKVRRENIFWAILSQRWNK